MRVYGVLIATLLFASTAVAAEVASFKVDDVLAQQQQIRLDVMAGRGRYAKMPESKRNDLLSKQEQLMHMLRGKQTSSDLSNDQYMQAFATLEWIEATINNRDDERLVCKREKAIGSTRVTRSCRTVAQMEAERERAREQMDNSIIR